MVAFHPTQAPSEAFLDLVATRFRALGEPMRLRIIHSLIDGEKTVTELVRALDATQANISRHLQTLQQAGLLKRRKEGLYVYYRIADQGLLLLCEFVCGDVKKSHAALAESLASPSED